MMRKTNSVPVRILWGTATSPYGSIFLAESPSGITHLSFFNGDEAESLHELNRDRPDALMVRDDGFAAKLAKRIFSGENDLPLDMEGTLFQRKVWEALLKIPAGKTTSYGEIAAAIGMPGASRAVGSAVGANRISWLIPCHRVIRADGGIGGYRWGVERKKAMLARELTPP